MAQPSSFKPLKNVHEAIKWVIDNFGGRVLTQYYDLKNKKYENYVVGYVWMLGKHKFLVTFRGRGAESYCRKGEGAKTGMTDSEIKWQAERGIHRVVIFQEPDLVRPYIFEIEQIVEETKKPDADCKIIFKSAGANPNPLAQGEDEPVWNIPLRIAVDLEKWLLQEGW